MLPPFIIEQVRKREEERKREHDRPVVRLPLEEPPPLMPEPPNEDKDERGVVIIELRPRS